jgi:hypothetical protein
MAKTKEPKKTDRDVLDEIAVDALRFFTFKPFDCNTTPPQEMIDDLLEWADHPYSLALPQFLGLKKMPYEWVKIWNELYPEVREAWNAAKAICCQRLFNYAMAMDRLPAHKQRIVNKYLDLYDVYAWDIQQAARQDANKEFVEQFAYELENWKVTKLHEEYEKFFAKNAEKRRKDKTDATMLSPTLTDNYLKHRVIEERNGDG